METTIPIGEFPVGKEHFSILTLHGDKGLGSLAVRFSGVFDGITAKIRWTLDGIEVLLIDTTSPVVMVVIVVMAVRLAGPRTGSFTAPTLAYLAFMGLWAMSMITVALIGTGRFCVSCLAFLWAFGLVKVSPPTALPNPFLISCKPCRSCLPYSDYSVYCVFGTGKQPSVLATITFAMPPVIRLTALGMRGVLETTKEAATAFGCSRWQLL